MCTGLVSLVGYTEPLSGSPALTHERSSKEITAKRVTRLGPHTVHSAWVPASVLLTLRQCAKAHRSVPAADTIRQDAGRVSPGLPAGRLGIKPPHEPGAERQCLQEEGSAAVRLRAQAMSEIGPNCMSGWHEQPALLQQEHSRQGWWNMEAIKPLSPSAAVDYPLACTSIHPQALLPQPQSCGGSPLPPLATNSHRPNPACPAPRLLAHPA